MVEHNLTRLKRSQTTTWMLDETPIWEFQAKQLLNRWYEHVQLVTYNAVCQGFFLDRRTGSV